MCWFQSFFVRLKAVLCYNDDNIYLGEIYYEAI